MRLVPSLQYLCARARRAFLIASAFALLGLPVLPERLLRTFEPTAQGVTTFTANSTGDGPATANLSLSDAAGASHGSPTIAIVNIADTLLIPQVSINNASINEESLGGKEP